MTREERLAVEITRHLIREGKLIAGGFAAYCLVNKIEPGDPRKADLKAAYMSGACHLWSSMFSTLDPEEGPTAADERRMESIQREVEAWEARERFQHMTPTKGSA